MVEGLPNSKNKHIAFEGCALGKQHKEEFPTHTDNRKREVLELVHTNACGTIETRSLNGAHVLFIFIDDRSRYTWDYFIIKKSGMSKYFKEFKNLVEKKIR